MDGVTNTLSILLLYILWKINVLYERYFGKETSNSKNLTSTLCPVLKRINSRRIILGSLSAPPTPSPIFESLTPIEEEMFKFSCGNNDNTFSEKLRDYEEHTHIPRSMFTAMWIDSCIK
ncbi:hypothetical protein QE152_g33539 [Popillia japonica]|uniref:Uncharacterized protein n=1 Tax=Popillia japonica TaxID=7064 RepID=A0AAW1IWS1_POPJA